MSKQKKRLTSFEIVAHRGVTDEAPENTLPAFLKAIELGADAVELDVRLTQDGVAVVFHDSYLQEITDLSGPIFSYSYEQLRAARFSGDKNQTFQIPRLDQIMEEIGGKIGLEIEIKGPEPESTQVIGRVLRDYRSLWDSIEVTSFEPQHLVRIQRECPGITADLLFPWSEDWMGPDVVAYTAVHRTRLAGARAVHLHSSQLSPEIVKSISQAGIEVHAWDVNGKEALQAAFDLQIPNICTDKLTEALAFRANIG